MSVRHSLLALLSEGPKYGFQLRQEFEASTGDVWPLNVGQVYTTLQRLERDGYAESDDSDDDERQRNYRITAKGDEELSHWLRTPPDLSEPPRDELVIKILVASRLPDVDVHEVIQVHRRYVVQVMQQWTRLKEDEAHLDLAFALATIGHSSGGGSCQYQNLQPPPPRTHLIIRSFTMALMMPPNIPIPRWIPSRGIIESPMTAVGETTSFLDLLSFASGFFLSFESAGGGALTSKPMMNETSLRTRSEGRSEIKA